MLTTANKTDAHPRSLKCDGVWRGTQVWTLRLIFITMLQALQPNSPWFEFRVQQTYWPCHLTSEKPQFPHLWDGDISLYLTGLIILRTKQDRVHNRHLFLLATPTPFLHMVGAPVRQSHQLHSSFALLYSSKNHFYNQTAYLCVFE